MALYTFGILKAELGSDMLAEFISALPGVFDAAGRSWGFIGHALAERQDLLGKPRLGEAHGLWGTYIAPRYVTDNDLGQTPPFVGTLSLWNDAASARQFSYNGLHRSALLRRADWFIKGAWPTYVLWWIENDRTPTWEEGVRRLEWLDDHGPTPKAFDFETVYGEIETT